MSTFLLANNESISQQQAFSYLHRVGKLQLFVTEILRQYVIDQELKSHPDLIPDAETIDRLMNEFCQKQQISDPQQFQQWLHYVGMDSKAFCQQIIHQWVLQQLVNRVTQPRLHEYFIQRKESLNQIYFSCIAVPTQALAEELWDQLEEGALFEQLVNEYSIADNREDNGRMAPITQNKLPESLRVVVDIAEIGDVLEPFPDKDRWYLFRLDRIAEASFESVKEQLQTELFEIWLTERVRKLNITL